MKLFMLIAAAFITFSQSALAHPTPSCTMNIYFKHFTQYYGQWDIKDSLPAYAESKIRNKAYEIVSGTTPADYSLSVFADAGKGYGKLDFTLYDNRTGLTVFYQTHHDSGTFWVDPISGRTGPVGIQHYKAVMKELTAQIPGCQE